MSAITTNNKTASLDVSSLTPEQKRALLAELKKRKEDSQKAMQLSPEDLDLICNKFNETEVKFESDCIATALESAFLMYATNTALVDGKQTISYADLHEKVNRLANKLIQSGAKKGDLIPILLPQSIEMFAAILALLKIGAAYVPLDEKFPEARVESILEISGAKLGIGQFKNDSADFTTIVLDDLENYPPAFNSPVITANDLAYVIFTSGSTGAPKGVMINHRALANLNYWFIDYFQVKAQDITSKFAGAAFDVSVAEIFPFLLKGSTIHILCEELKQDPIAVNDYFNENGVNIAFLPTQFCQLFMELENKSLQTLITAGEKLNKYQQQPYKLYNLYGPTENTVYTSCFEVRENLANIPIGKPIANNQLYILDANMQVLPIGHKGELYISGEQLSMGYLNQPELTAEKFLSNPFIPGQKIYRSGDICSFLPSGDILYYDRIDNQVKIRGYRIELGEIETTLLQHTSIEACVALSKKDSTENTYLIAYYVSDQELLPSELRAHLLGFLPEYMIPAYFIAVPEIPLTPNGKVDKKALLEKEIEIGSKEAYLAPQNVSQERILHYWKQILRPGTEEQSRIGIRDNFFEIGGNSLAAIKTVSKMTHDFVIKVNQLFEFPTIESLDKEITYNPDNVRKKIENLIRLIEHQKEHPPKVQQENISFLRQAIRAEQNPFQQTEKDISRGFKSYFITGALGYLGMHLLYELLFHTDAHLHLLIRAKDEKSAFERLKAKWQFYFPKNELTSDFSKRISCYTGDVSLPGLGITELPQQVDCLLHIASKTSHYGEWEDFYNINVEGTKNVILFAKDQGIKSIQSISTISVGTGKAEESKLFFSENYGYPAHKSSNYYVQSKIEQERALFDLVGEDTELGLYRIGNLMPAFETGNFQENAKENAFMGMLKLYFEFKLIPDLRAKTYDFSYIDQTAQAIRLLLSVQYKKRDIYHITNDFPISDADIQSKIEDRWPEVKRMPITEVLTDLLENMNKPNYLRVIEEYIANSKILDSGASSKFYVHRDFTSNLLKKLGFSWNKPSKVYFEKFLTNLEQNEYFTTIN